LLLTLTEVAVFVVKVKWASSDKLSKKVALKIISKKKAPMDFQQKFLPRELDVMKMLDHPHIIKLYDILYINDKVIYEPVIYGNIFGAGINRFHFLVPVFGAGFL